MNRYRSLPGLGPQKASASTTCQKCLKKGHYSYECKASLSDRPYAARPSRTQVLRNPGLVKLSSERKDEDRAMGIGLGTESAGVADAILGERQRERRLDGERRSRSPAGEQNVSGRRQRSMSSADSVSTMSTNRNGSKSPAPGSIPQLPHPTGQKNGFGRRSLSTSPSTSPRKRRYHSPSTASDSQSPQALRQHADAHPRKSRRQRTASPDDRGRPHSLRRGSRRSRSGSDGISMNKSRITKQRRSLDEDNMNAGGDQENENNEFSKERPFNASHQSSSGEKTPRFRDLHGTSDRQRDANTTERDFRGRDRNAGGGGGRDGGRDGFVNRTPHFNHRDKERRNKERSLSPYSRRLALTQSMNMGR